MRSVPPPVPPPVPRPRRRAATGAGADDPVTEAAWLYYHDGLNQNEIAARLGVSRATVVNYLQDARDRGDVRIHLSDQAFTSHRLAKAVAARYGLVAAYIVDEGSDAAATLGRVARGAAEWLPGLLAPGDRLGVAWGQTIHGLATQMAPTPIEDLTVLQLVGSMATPYGFTAEKCSTLLADRLGAECVNLHTPAVLSNASLAGLLRQEPIIARQLEALSHCNKAVFAAGSADTNSHVVSSGVATVDELRAFREAGAVGVLCGRFIDAGGQAVDGALNERIMGVPLDRLQGLEMGLLVSVGAEKLDPMRAVLRGGYATHLVTSTQMAEALLGPA